MDIKRTKLAALIAATLATGCSASKLDAPTPAQEFCQNGGKNSQYSCAEQAPALALNGASVENPNTEAWMNSKLSDIKSWLKTIKENPEAANSPGNPSAAMTVRNPAATNPGLVRIERMTQQGDHRGALASVNSFLADNPENLEAELTKGLVLINMGRPQEAEALLRNSISRHPTSPELYNNLAVIYSNRGDYGKAIETLLLAFSTHPSYAQVNENLREVYASVASLAYNRALDLDASSKITPQLVVLRRTASPTLPVVASTSLSASVAAVAAPPASNPKPAPAKAVVASAPPAAAKPKPAAPAKAEQPAKPVSGGTSIALALPKLEDPAPAKPVKEVKLKPATKPAKSTASVVRLDKKPTPKPKPTAVKTADSATTAAVKAVKRWSWTWSSQNVNAYLGSYIEGYTPKAGVSHKQWRETRTSRLTRPSFIKIKLAKISTKKISSSQVDVTFHQSYSADTYKDQTNKRLTLKKVGSRWLISKERNI
ncbi:MAG: tetratricopeptide repeat protein [Pseudomonadales bacterium]